MNASLVERPRLAVATALAIVAAVAVVAALLPNAGSPARTPERGNSVEDLWGRTFVTVEATEDGQPHQLREDLPIYATFRLHGGSVAFGTACGELDADYRLDEGQLDWRQQPTTEDLPCGGRRLSAGKWVEAFLAERPAWQLNGNTLELSSDFGTMTMVDKGEGSKPAEILGQQFREVRPGVVEKGEQPRFRPTTWLTLSFDRDGTMHAQLGCESVVVPTEVRTGWFRIARELKPKRTDCSPGQAALDTAWLWDVLSQPVQWQVTWGDSLALKPYQSDQVLLASRVSDRGKWITNPGLLAGKTFYAAPKTAAWVTYVGPAIIEVGDDGTFTASAGCERPSIHGRFRNNWVQFGTNQEWSLSACESSAAEQRLGDLLAYEPAWFLARNGELNLWSGQRILGFAEADDYEDVYLEPPPSDVEGN